MSRSHGPASADRAATIRKILALRGFSLADLARASSSGAKQRGGRIPHNLYSSVRRRNFNPSLYQLERLSALTGYCLADWLAVFGFSLDNISRFQAQFPAVRTVELDARVYSPGRSFAWFPETRGPDLCAPLMPLSKWLELSLRPNVRFVPGRRASAYRFVKIGCEDAFAFPDLLPQSIVRIDRRRGVASESSTGLLLVEHSNGLTCTRLSRATSGKLVLCSRQLPYAPVELKEGEEAVLLGAADFEIRLPGKQEAPRVPARLGSFWTPARLPKAQEGQHVGDFIRKARVRSGLSFREASERTRLIARSLGNPRYYCSPGTLSDFEARKELPRQIHKIISVCAVYFASGEELLRAAGIRLEEAGSIPMPAELLDEPAPAFPEALRPSAFFEVLEHRYGQVPYFLAPSLGSLFALPDFSVRDVFWAGGLRATEESGLSGALFFVVDRRQKTPRPSLSSPAWQQPIYVLVEREGTYRCGFCTLQNGTLILRPCVAELPRLMRFGNRTEAEVVGRIIGMVRRVPGI
jgi:transcriptional regulator with XRE-family HTH domain